MNIHKHRAPEQNQNFILSQTTKSRSDPLNQISQTHRIVEHHELKG